MTLFEAILLGLVEGITEYLPVSSTGHLIITESLLGIKNSDAIDAFTIVIQGGAILAVLGLYRKRVVQMIQGLLGKNPTGLKLAINIIIAFIPAVILGLLFDDLIDKYLFHTWPVIIALALGGVWMIILDYRQKRKTLDPDNPGDFLKLEDLTPIRALIIGLLQCVAMWPGTSRSMMTIAGGTMLGMKPKDAAEFSFLLGLPTLGGACVYKLFSNIKDAADAGQDNMFQVLGILPVAVGILVATISAALAIKWLVSFLTKHGLAPFGVYRIILAATLYILIAANLVGQISK